jgi:hypothetical protein
MKVFWNWFIKNLSNIFSFIGILLTLYFGIYYVPNWLRETQNEKIESAQINLQQSIKELIYSESVCKIQEIEPLIKAKEIELNGPYPISRIDVLTKVQDSFMQDKFLPLENRKKLLAEIDMLKLEIKPLQASEAVNRKKSSTLLYEWLSIIVAILGVIVGVISIFLNFRSEKEKQEEIDNQLVSDDDLKYAAHSGIAFEKSITNVIESYGGVEILRTSTDRDFGFDLEFSYNEKKYYVEVKHFTRNKVGLRSFHQFLTNLKGLEGEFWFVHNTDLTDMVRRKADEAQKLQTPKRKIKLIQVQSPELFRDKLNNLFNS